MTRNGAGSAGAAGRPEAAGPANLAEPRAASEGELKVDRRSSTLVRSLAAGAAGRKSPMRRTGNSRDRIAVRSPSRAAKLRAKEQAVNRWTPRPGSAPGQGAENGRRQVADAGPAGQPGQQPGNQPGQGNGSPMEGGSPMPGGQPGAVEPMPSSPTRRAADAGTGPVE